MKSIQWILAGKQIGYEEIRKKNDIKFYFAVAVQKWKGKYKIFTSEIEENLLSFLDECIDKEDETDKVIQVDTIEDVLEYFNEMLHIDIEKLHPLKGQKLFNPRF